MSDTPASQSQTHDSRVPEVRNSALRISRPRKTLNIDLGPLRKAVEMAAAASAVKPSAWIRSAVRSQLAAQSSSSTPMGDLLNTAGTDPARGPGVYRAWFNREQTAKLDDLVACSGRRSRIHVLHALLDGVQLTPGGSEAHGAGLADAVQTLVRSNHELVAFGRNLHQIARSLQTHPGRTTAADRLALDDALKSVRTHVEAGARLAAELRPLVKFGPADAVVTPRRPIP